MPHLAVVAVAVLAAVFATEGTSMWPVGMIHVALLVPALRRPLPAWWLSLVMLPVFSLRSSFGPCTGWAWAVHAGLLFLVALRNRPRVMAETVSVSAARLLGGGSGLGASR